MSSTQTNQGSQPRGSNLLLKEAPTTTQPRLQDILGDLEARLLQQIYYWINNPYKDHYLKCEIELRTYQGRIWAKIPPAFFLNRWRGKFRFVGERTLKGKFTALRNRGVLLTEKFGGDTNWYCVLDETVIHYDGIFQTYFDLVATERTAARNDENSKLRDITGEREEEIWEEMQKELEASFLAHGDAKALKKEWAARDKAAAKAKAANEQKARDTAQNASSATDEASTADEQCKICTTPVQASDLSASSADSAPLEGKICTAPEQILHDANAKFGVAPYIQEQQQEFVEEQTIQEAGEAPLISPLADALQAFLPPVVCSLNSSVVVEDDEIGRSEDSASDTAATRRELIAENVTERDADALLSRFGPDACLAALDQTGGIKKLIAQLRTLENAAQSAAPAPAEATAPKVQTTTPKANTAPQKAIPLPPGHEMNDADAEAQVAATYAELGFTGGLKGAARFVARHGARECAYQLRHLPSEDDLTTNAGAYLRRAVLHPYRFKDDPIDGAAPAARDNRPIKPRPEDIAAENVEHDAQFEAMPEVEQKRIESFTRRLLGASAADSEAFAMQRRVVTLWAVEGRLDEAIATKDEIDADFAKARAATDEARRKTA